MYLDKIIRCDHADKFGCEDHNVSLGKDAFAKQICRTPTSVKTPVSQFHSSLRWCPKNWDSRVWTICLQTMPCGRNVQAQYWTGCNVRHLLCVYFMSSFVCWGVLFKRRWLWDVETLNGIVGWKLWWSDSITLCNFFDQMKEGKYEAFFAMLMPGLIQNTFFIATQNTNSRSSVWGC